MRTCGARGAEALAALAGEEATLEELQRYRPAPRPKRANVGAWRALHGAPSPSRQAGESKRVLVARTEGDERESYGRWCEGADCLVRSL